MVLGILILLNVLSSVFHTRFDLTKENRFTLTEATTDLLEEMEDEVIVTVYLDGEMPAGIKRLKNATRDMLDEFRAYTGNQLQYSFDNSLGEAETTEAKRNIIKSLGEKGLSPQRFRINEGDGFEEKVFIPGAIFKANGREYPVNLLEALGSGGSQESINNSIALLEYKMANAIQKLGRDGLPRIGFLRGHGELDTAKLADVAASLSTHYIISELNLDDFTVAPNEYDLLVVAKPTKRFDEKDKFKIDQFITHGGKVLWCVENLAADIDSLKNKPYYSPTPFNLNLEDMLFKYGVRINDNIIQDLQANPIPLVVSVDQLGNAQQQSMFPWLYHPVFTNANQEHPITKNLGAVQGEFVATIDTIKQEKVKKDILLTSSQYTKVFYPPIKIEVEQARQKNNPEQFRKSYQPVAVALEGQFESVFKNRLAVKTEEMIQSMEGFEFMELSEPNKMVVIADGDVLKNDYDNRNRRSLPLGYNKFAQKNYENKTFVLNAVEWLLDNSGIIVARNKNVELRLLDVERIKKEKTFWQVLNIAVPLLLVLIFGLVYNVVRCRRFA